MTSRGVPSIMLLLCISARIYSALRHRYDSLPVPHLHNKLLIGLTRQAFGVHQILNTDVNGPNNNI